MAVLVEAISIIVRVETIDTHFERGLDGYKEIVPNTTFCTDGRLTRVGFMIPQDAAYFETALENAGLTPHDGTRWIDMAVAEQLGGLTSQCDWLKVGKYADGPAVAGMLDEDFKNHGTAFLPGDLYQRYEDGSLDPLLSKQLVGENEITVACPAGWEFSGSLSDKYWFTPTDPDQPGTQKWITTEEHSGGPISKRLYAGRAYPEEADNQAEEAVAFSYSGSNLDKSRWSRWRRAMAWFRD